MKIEKIALLACFFVASSSFFTQAQACNVGDENEIYYMLRDKNRCEGIKSIDVAGTVNLVSFTIGELPESKNIVEIKIPYQSDINPNFSPMGRK